MKVISLNIRGMGVVNKKNWVKDICRKEKPNVFRIQETKNRWWNDTQIGALWGG